MAVPPCQRGGFCHAALHAHKLHSHAGQGLGYTSEYLHAFCGMTLGWRGPHLLQKAPQQAWQHGLALRHGLEQRQLRVRVVGGAALRMRRTQGRPALR